MQNTNTPGNVKMLGDCLTMSLKTARRPFVQMDDIENKVDIWEHQQVRQDVWELQHELNKLREEFEELRNKITSDGK